MTDLSKAGEASLIERFEKQFGTGRPLTHPLEDYWISVDGKTGELGYQWSDKPHRHVYDLLHEIVRLREALRSSSLMLEEAERVLEPIAQRLIDKGIFATAVDIENLLARLKERSK